jgi:hypothetical protein
MLNPYDGGKQKLSTNEKLALFINAKDDINDEDEIMEWREVEKRAKARLKKAAFYGNGSLAKVPKTRKQKQASQSPFTILKPKVSPERPVTTYTVVPPGAHYDQFRLVQFPTKRSKEDPERVFFTTTSFTEGVEFNRQPPWYYGYNNKTKPPDDDMITAASRYGFRGSKAIKQRHTEFYELPSRTRNEHTPNFLDGDDVVNEYVPQIYAAKVQTINNMETPKLWPSNTAFVSGSKLKEPPNKTFYNRETTVGSAERPSLDPSLTNWFDTASSLDNQLNDLTMLERTGAGLSPPQTAIMNCADTWKDRVSRTASTALRGTMKRHVEHYNPHTLVDPTDVMKYSGSTAFIIHTQTAEELKFRNRIKHSQSLIQYEIIWRQVHMLFRHLKTVLKRDMTLTDVISDLARTLRREAKTCGSVNSLSRSDFVKAVTKYAPLAPYPKNQLSVLFSAFDPMKRNSIRFVDFIACLVTLDGQMATTFEKLGRLWDTFAHYGDDQPPIEIAQAVFLSCCYCEADKVAMQKVIKTIFREMCYKISILGFSAYPIMPFTGRRANTKNKKSKVLGFRSDRHDVSAGTSEGTGHVTRQQSSYLTSTSPKRLNTADSLDNDREQSSSVSFEEPSSAFKMNMQAYKSTAADIHQHNLCDDFLSRSSFIEVCKRCPEVIGLFDTMLSARLADFYGRDSRYEDDEILTPQTPRAKDFKWILHGKK